VFQKKTEVTFSRSLEIKKRSRIEHTFLLPKSTLYIRCDFRLYLHLTYTEVVNKTEHNTKSLKQNLFKYPENKASLIKNQDERSPS